MENPETYIEKMTLVYGTLAMLIMGFSVVFFILLYQRKLIKKNIENQKIQTLLQTQEMKTAYALLEGQDQERKRIASELHDNLGSILVTINMYADKLYTTEDHEKIKNLSERISLISQQANLEIRKISHSLDSGMLKHFGLKAAIVQLMEAIGYSKPVELNTILDIKDDIPKNIGIEVYRIVQELVNNTLKHAACKSIRLEICTLDDSISLLYHDDGIGFDPRKVTKGMGIANIEKRTEKLDGELKMESEDDGTTFNIELPYNQ